jgi:hypothetical protein
VNRFLWACAVALFVLAFSRSARADKVAVLPFAPSGSAPAAEVEAAREWARKAVTARGHTLPSDPEMLSAEMAIKDGVADTSEEYLAAGRSSGSDWTLSGRLERVEIPPSTTPDGASEEGYSALRLELEVCQVSSGRVESLARDIEPADAVSEVSEMLALLLRPEGIANAEIPWRSGVRKKKPAPPPPSPEPTPAPPPRETGPPPAPPPAYAEGHPLAVGLSVGVTNALARPDQARGPSWAMPIGGVLAYALEGVRGLELRGVLTSQAIGPRALELAGGARYAIPVFPRYRVFVGPELLVGAHVALGAVKTTRFLTHGAAFAAIGIGPQVQLEIAGDLAAALGGAGSLVLGGGTFRALYRF